MPLLVDFIVRLLFRRAKMVLRFLSWNVAGWETTARKICQDYGTVDGYFDKHGADVVFKRQRSSGADYLMEKA